MEGAMSGFDRGGLGAAGEVDTFKVQEYLKAKG